jgi:hypothetical protein
MGTCLARDLAPERSICSRKRWSWARRMRSVGEGADIITGESPILGQLAENPNDSEGAAIAHRILRNLRARSCAETARAHEPGSRVAGRGWTRWEIKSLP